MLHYFEAILCLVSTYLYWRAFTSPTPVAEKDKASQKIISRTWLGKLVPFWRSVPVFSGIAQAYFLFNNPNITLPWRAQYDIGLILIFFGGLLRVWCYRKLGQAFTFYLKVERGQKVVDTGFYSVIRHPSYLGFFAVMAGNVLCFVGPLNLFCTLLPNRMLDLGLQSFPNPTMKDVVRSGLAIFGILVWGAYAKAILRRCPAEEELLIKELGSSYEAYMKKVPYRLIPYVW